ncbi:MAG: lipoprotein, partial [Lachnospiraceae bacterium]|nr:lipoprotein [Lachnospiraceae bacterium]
MRRENRLIKHIPVWFAAVMLAAVLSGCGQKTAGGKGGVKIFFSLNEMDTFRQTLVD